MFIVRWVQRHSTFVHKLWNQNSPPRPCANRSDWWGREGGGRKGGRTLNSTWHAPPPATYLLWAPVCHLIMVTPWRVSDASPVPSSSFYPALRGGRCPANHRCLKMAETVVVFQQPFTSGVCCMAILYGWQDIKMQLPANYFRCFVNWTFYPCNLDPALGYQRCQNRENTENLQSP